MDSLNLDRLTVMKGRMRLELSWPVWTPKLTDRELADEVIAMYPTICAHSCINSAGPTFGHVIHKTTLPHLLEHMIIEEQIAQHCEDVTAAGKAIVNAMVERPLVGTTTVTEGGRQATVEVSFFDDLIAARAIGFALEKLNDILPCKPYMY